jgi:hypothetical protein
MALSRQTRAEEHLAAVAESPGEFTAVVVRISSGTPLAAKPGR